MAMLRTIELANLFRMKHIPIGEHGGKKLGKIGLMERRKRFIWRILCPITPWTVPISCTMLTLSSAAEGA
jgi:hypothetical protein